MKLPDIPSNWLKIEKQEQLEYLSNIVDTATSIRTKLDKLKYERKDYPKSLNDYTKYLMHDSARDIGNLVNYIGKQEINSGTWRMMYACLHWIMHIQILIEYRINDPELPEEAS